MINKGGFIKITMFAKLLCVAMTVVMLTGCALGKEEAKADVVRIGSLKGPTSMGLLFLMEQAQNEQAQSDYEFTMAVQADELLPLMVKGELDIALLPANVAAVLYQKMEGELAVIDINTLGVLYMVTGDKSIKTVEDLKGRTIYLTGKGTTPDYVLRYFLEGNGLTQEECKLEYKSEATEVAALLAKNKDAVGLLPQPFVTAACMQNEELSVAFDMNEEWTKLQGAEKSRMVTGVTVVRKTFLKEQNKAVTTFLQDHQKSTESMNQNTQAGAALAVKAGIIAKEDVAKKAINACNITYIDGEDMKQALSGYLSVLFEQNPEAVGGALPGEDFYYVP